MDKEIIDTINDFFENLEFDLNNYFTDIEFIKLKQELLMAIKYFNEYLTQTSIANINFSEELKEQLNTKIKKVSNILENENWRTYVELDYQLKDLQTLFLENSYKTSSQYKLKKLVEAISEGKKDGIKEARQPQRDGAAKKNSKAEELFYEENFKPFLIDWNNGEYDNSKTYLEIIEDIKETNNVGNVYARRMYKEASQIRKRIKTV